MTYSALQSLFKLLRKRRSIRMFKKKEINSKKVLNTILQACDMAPSSGGLQTFEIYNVKKDEIKKQIAIAAKDQAFIGEASLLLIFCTNPSRSIEKFGERSKLFSIQDATIAAAYAQLAISSIDLSSVWIGNFDDEKVAEILRLPSDEKPVAILPIGYPNEKPKEKVTRGARGLIHDIT